MRGTLIIFNVYNGSTFLEASFNDTSNSSHDFMIDYSGVVTSVHVHAEFLVESEIDIFRMGKRQLEHFLLTSMSSVLTSQGADSTPADESRSSFKYVP